MLSSHCRILLLLIILMLGLPSFAAKNLGVITMIKGPAEVFVRPNKNAAGPKPRVKFEGLYYTIRKAKMGFKLKFDHVLKTGPNTKLKLTFTNGDSLIMGGGTALAMSQYASKGKVKSQSNQMLNLIYGNARGVVSKEGPRANLRIKTKSAVAGVRGTDFNIKYVGFGDKTEISVIRGAVAVRQKDQPTSKSLVLKKGYVAEIKNLPKPSGRLPEKGQGPINGAKGVSGKLGGIPSMAAFEKPVKVKILSKQKLKDISKESTLPPVSEIIKEEPAEVQKVVMALEKKSLDVVLKDIKQTDPEQYKAIEKSRKKDGSSISINNKVIEDLTEKAPEVEETEKVSEEELLKGLEQGDDVYKKYFK